MTFCPYCGTKVNKEDNYCYSCGENIKGLQQEMSVGVKTNDITPEERNKDRIYKVARRRIKAKKGFYTHFTAWAIVNSILIIVWALSGQGHPWFLWPLGIWGVFVLGDYLRVFVFGKGSDRQAIEKEVEKIRAEQI